MNIKNLCILLFFSSMFSISLAQQGSCKLADKLFRQLSIFPSQVDQKKLDNFFKKVTISCEKEQCQEIEVLDLLIQECTTKLYHYKSLITDKSNYKKALPMLCLSFITGLFIYVNYKFFKNIPQNIEIIKQKLYKLGAMNIFVGNGYASAWSYKCDETQIKQELQILANISSNNSKLKFIVEVFCTSLIALAAGKCGIDELLDQIYAQFYYKKYCFIKDGLEKQRASIIRNA
jgi:hypothetical protein